MLKRTPFVLSWLLMGAWAACGTPGPRSTAPSAPTSNDDSYSISRVEGWYLVGNSLTAGQDELSIEVSGPKGTEFIDLWIDDQPGLRLEELPSSFGAIIDISDLEAGDHQLLLAANGSNEAFAQVSFKRTHPLYVVVSTDWDDPDNTDVSLRLQEELHDNHPELKITHFVGPYTFTDPDMKQERIQIQADWVRGMRDTYDDEIGVHIHPYCSFVEAAGVDCRNEPSFVYNNGDSSGYTVPCAAYTEDEFTALLKHATDIFAANDLGRPTSFRAGGWTTDLKVMAALERTGYVVDTSANNWARMEEWEGQANGMLYDWNKENWASIGDTSQPYYPSRSDILEPGGDAFGVLQVPDNGILVDYVTSEEMIEIFDANWDGGALTSPVNLSIGWHPSNFVESYKDRMDDTMDHLDGFLASKHRGPVVYETLSNMVQIWPANP